jgi:flagellar FliJ protein
MKRFKFSLEALLRLRLRAEETVKRELAAKNRQIIQAQGELKEIEHRHKELQKDQKAQRSQVADILSLRAAVAFRHKLLLDMQLKGQEIARSRRDLEAIRRKLVQATKERRAIEIVKENRFAEWREEYQAQEREFIDDVSQKAYIRKQKAAAVASVEE